tara:strand:- start:61 stop:1026 length:966 start_codon:yes stop_codon:yes gene_type:complete
MEQIIALVLLFTMIFIDYFNIERFFNFCRSKVKTLPKKMANKETKNTLMLPRNYGGENTMGFLGKINVWVLDNRKSFNENIRSVGTDMALVDLCIDSIKKHTNPSRFNLKILNMDDIHTLLPEYSCYIKECKNSYTLTNFVKYAMLKKFGGIWIPSDTLLLKSLEYNNKLLREAVVTYGRNNTNLIDNHGLDDNILAASVDNPLINNMIQYFKSNLNTFQNSVYFKKAINKHFNKSVKSYTHHIHSKQLVEKTAAGRFMTLDDLFTTNYTSFDGFFSKGMLNINISHIEGFHKYNYVLRMSKQELLDSNLFLSYLLKKALQ